MRIPQARLEWHLESGFTSFLYTRFTFISQINWGFTATCITVVTKYDELRL